MSKKWNKFKRILSLVLAVQILLFNVDFRVKAAGNQLISFAYPDFNGAAMNGLLNLVGSPIAKIVKPQNGSPFLRLTENNYNQRGAAFFNQKVSVAEDKSFSTYFSFRFGGGTPSPADGIVFVVNNNSNSLGEMGLGIGYKGIRNSVAVEFDTWYNGAVDTNPLTGQVQNDVSANHIGINIRGSAASVAQVNMDNSRNPYINLRDASVKHAWVDYNGAEKKMYVYINTSNTRPTVPTITYPIDLSKELNSTDVYVGFTSGTGAAHEYHDILNWYFDSKYNPIDTTTTSYGTAATSVVATATPASNTTTSTIKATVKDAFGNNVADGTKVTFTTDRGTLSQAVATTINGFATVTLTGAGASGTANIKAVAEGGAFGTTTVTNLIAAINVKDSVKSGHEDTVMNFAAGDFVSINESIKLVRITSLPPAEAGVLKLNGNNVDTNGMMFPANLGGITFTPATNWSGTTSFKWEAVGATTNAVSNQATMTLNIAGVNDAPLINADQNLRFFSETVRDNSYVTIPDLHLGNSYTMEAWIYVKDYTQWARIFDFGAGPGINNQFLALEPTTGRMVFDYRTENGTAYNIVTSESVPKNQWIHVAGVANATDRTMSIYWNGVLKASINNVAAFSSASVNRPYSYIGRSNWDSPPDDYDDEFSGYIKDARLWTTARTAAEINSAMNSTLTGNESGLKAYYKMNEKNGTILFDSAGTAENGTIQAGAQWRGIERSVVQGQYIDIPFTVEDIDTINGPFTVTAGSSNIAAIPNANLTVSGTGKQRTLRVTAPSTASLGLTNIIVTARDNAGAAATYEFEVNVLKANQKPVAINKNYQVDEDKVLDVQAFNGLLVGASDEENQPMTAVVEIGPSKGSVSIKNDGSFSYTPNKDFNGNDTFTYKVSDGSLQSDARIVTIKVNPSNDEPTNLNITKNNIEENRSAGTEIGTLSAQDIDDGDEITFSIVSEFGDASSFTIIGNKLYSNAVFDYERETSKRIKIKAADSEGESVEKEYTINITNVNEAPTDIVMLNNSVEENKTIKTEVSGFSFSDPDAGDTAVYSLTAGIGDYDNGSFIIENNKLYTKTSFDYESGRTKYIRVKVTDSKGAAYEEAFAINVINVNEAPVVENILKASNEDQTVTFEATDFTSRFRDIDGDSLSKIRITKLPANGTLKLNGEAVSNNALIAKDSLNGLTFVPNENWYGVTSFEYKGMDESLESNTAAVNITITAVNDAPVAVTDVYSISEDSVLNIAANGILANDTDVEGDALKAILVSGTTNGSLSLNENGSFTYTPNKDFNGNDYFSYKVYDGIALSMYIARVQIVVRPVNDAISSISISNNNVPENSDPANEIGSFTITDVDPNFNVLRLVNGEGDNDNDKFEIRDGKLYAKASFDYEYKDEQGKSKTTYNIRVRATEYISGTEAESFDKCFTINVMNINEYALAGDVIKGGAEDIPLIFTRKDFEDEFKDLDSDALNKIQIVSLPTNGILELFNHESAQYEAVKVDSEIAADNINDLRFVPSDNWNGEIRNFKYRGSDGDLYSNDAFVYMTITPVNDAPIAVMDVYNTTEDTALVVNADSNDRSVLAMDTDVDLEEGKSLKAILVSGPAHGSLVFDENGYFTYTPNEGFSGEDSFTYRAYDGVATSEETPVIISISEVNDAPTYLGLSNNIIMENNDIKAKVGELSAIDTDSSDMVTYSLVPGEGSEDNGSFTIEDGVLYTSESFDFEKLNGSNTKTIRVRATDLDPDDPKYLDKVFTITIVDVNESPIVRDIAKAGEEDKITQFASEDFANTNVYMDPENDELNKIKITSLPSNGLLMLGNTEVKVDDEIAKASLSSLSFNPAANWSGHATFNYKASDGNSYSNEGFVQIDMEGVNDAPTVPGSFTEIPTNVIFKNGDSVNVEFGISTDVEDNPITYILEFFDGKVWNKLKDINTNSYNYELPSGLETTSAQFRVKAVDNFGAASEYTSSNIFAVDTKIPSLSEVLIKSNNPDSTKAKVGDVITLSFVGDEELKETPKVIIAGTEVTPSFENGKWTANYTIKDSDEEGRITFSIDYEDLAGNKGPKVTAATDNISISMDKIRPVITLIGEPSLLIEAGTNYVDEGAIASDNVDGNITSKIVTSNTVNSNVPGEYTVKYNVSDSSGNNAVEVVRQVKVIEKIMAIEVSGKITEQETGKVIGGAKVSIRDLKGTIVKETTANADGNYNFTNVSLGKYKLVVEKDGYSRNTIEFIAKPNSLIDQSVTVDAKLVTFKISFTANPNSIVGDGEKSTVLNIEVLDKNNVPLKGLNVEFVAPMGTFPDGNTAETDNNGKASKVYKAEKLEGIVSREVVVKAVVRDNVRNLHAEQQIIVTFEPSSIEGLVLDNDTKKPVNGAQVVVSKDFNGDGIVDFYAKMITGADGKYKIAVPKGNMDYNVSITKPVKIGNTEVPQTFNQVSKVKDISGAGKEVFPSVNTVAGLVLTKQTDGSIIPLQNSSNFKIEIFDKNKFDVTKGAVIEESAQFTSSIDDVGSNKGSFSSEGLERGKNYTVAVTYTFESGEKIVVGTADIEVKEDGQMTISTILIDPYGTITDAKTGKVIEGADVRLYYANTARNIANGRTPNTEVKLPVLEGFKPANNANPQVSDNEGQYAYMVFPTSDYYVKVVKEGYETYVSPTLSVEYEIVKHDIVMTPKKPVGTNPGTDVPNGGNNGSNPVVTNPTTGKPAGEIKPLPQTGSIIDMNVIILIGSLLLGTGLFLTLFRKKEQR